MKTNKIFALAALMGAFAFTSCAVDDNPVVIPSTPDTPVTPEEPAALTTDTISFEAQTLNEDGYWMGEENETGVDDGYGGTTYTCAFEESIAKFNTSYSVYYWSGYAVSSRTETSFDVLTTVPDQFNNVAGTAHTGKNFCVVNTYGQTIDFSKPATVKSLWFTNDAYTVSSIVNGDSYAGAAFEAEDWFKCTVTGTKADGSTATVDIDLAKEGAFVQDWQQADLSLLGEVVSLGFTFSGSRSNEWGVLTPAYICIDDIEIVY